MAAVGTCQVTWSNGTDSFCVAKIGTLLAIEERCDAGLSEIHSRLASGTWRVNDLVEVIRLGLIGGGMDAKEAKRVVDIHVLQNPNGLAPSILVARTIILAALFGVPDDLVGKKGAAEAKETDFTSKTDASAAQPFMDLEPSSIGRQDRSMNLQSGSLPPLSKDTINISPEESLP